MCLVLSFPCGGRHSHLQLGSCLEGHTLLGRKDGRVVTADLHHRKVTLMTTTAVRQIISTGGMLLATKNLKQNSSCRNVMAVLDI